MADGHSPAWHQKCCTATIPGSRTHAGSAHQQQLLTFARFRVSGLRIWSKIEGSVFGHERHSAQIFGKNETNTDSKNKVLTVINNGSNISIVTILVLGLIFLRWSTRWPSVAQELT